MCGINGIYNYRRLDPVDLVELHATRDFMTPRGPDSFGEWTTTRGHVGFGSRRLSIIDLTDAGTQPMSTVDKKITITFNGEIYNYRELQRELESVGFVFQSHSDTEVLLHLYRHLGVDMLSRLRGMFAFALWDADRESLLLARDPYGIKPLYYADDGNELRFASTVKALIAGGAISRDPDPAGIVGFGIFGSIPEPWSSCKAIKSLPAGSLATVDRHGLTAPRAYYSLAQTYCEAETRTIPERDVQEVFRDAVLDSVRHHLIADVPVGAFLSGGVDSGALVGLMRDCGQTNICTVTLAFQAFRDTPEDESALAAKIAAQYGASHTTRVVDSREFESDLPRIMQAMDQPSIDGINTWFVSKATRELGLKVALSGIGGDELLGGYSTFARLPKLVDAMRRVPRITGADSVVAAVVRGARGVGMQIHPKAGGVLTYGRTYPGAYLLQRSVYLPNELSAVLSDPDAIATGLAELRPLELISRTLQPEPSEKFSKVAVLESSLYLRNQLLRDTDWAGMAHSVEVRTPLVDSELLSRTAPIFASGSKFSGKTLLGRSPSDPLPEEAISKAKSGFGIPIKNWYLEQNKRLLESNSRRIDARLWSRAWMREISILTKQSAASENLLRST